MEELFSFKVDRLHSLMNQKQLYRMTSNTSHGWFPGVGVGTVGGLVEKPNNIHNSWIADSAMVIGNAIVNDCNVRKNAYICGDANIIGHYCGLGGDTGPVVIGGSVILDMHKDIDCGPISIFGDNITITGDSDIVSICGLFSNMGYNTHMTFYKPSEQSDILCYSHASNSNKPISLKDLPASLVEYASQMGDEDISAEYIDKLTRVSKQIIKMVKAQLQ